MHQLNILLAQEFKFLQNCDARGFYAPSSIIECAYLCCLCPSSPSPTPPSSHQPLPCSVQHGAHLAMGAPSLHQAPPRHPLQHTSFVGASLLLPKTLCGSGAGLQWDQWPIFGLVSNIPAVDVASWLFLCQHVLLGEGHTIPSRWKTSTLLWSMSWRPPLGTPHPLTCLTASRSKC